MDLDDGYYDSSPLKRTIEELINECSEKSEVKQMNPNPISGKSKSKKKPTFGQTRKPFIHVPLDHVVLDELHLMLRVTDVLTENLIREVIERDKRQGVTKALSGKYLNKLVKAIKDCGVSFSIWEKADGDGKGIGRYDWTSLMGSDKKKLISMLPDKLNGILHEDTASTVIEIWKVRAEAGLTNGLVFPFFFLVMKRTMCKRDLKTDW